MRKLYVPVPEGGCKKWDISTKNKLAQICFINIYVNEGVFCACLATFGKITPRRIHKIWLFLDQHLEHFGRNNEHRQMFNNLIDYDTLMWN